MSISSHDLQLVTTVDVAAAQLLSQEKPTGGTDGTAGKWTTEWTARGGKKQSSLRTNQYPGSPRPNKEWSLG